MLGLLIVAVFLGHAARYLDLAFLTRFEHLAYDLRLRMTLPGTVDPRIVIVDIDEKSLAAEGHWPWRRDRMATMMDQLFDRYHVALVGFDVVWAERDESSGLGVMQELARNELKDDLRYQQTLQALEPRLQFDRIFADHLRSRPVVLGYYFSADAAQRAGQLPKPALAKGIFQGRNVVVTRYTGYGANLEELQSAAASAGHFTPLPDEDGIVRRVPMLAEYEGAFYEPLSVAMVRLLQGSPELRPGFTDAPGWTKNYPGLEWLDLGDRRIPVDADVAALVPYRGKQGSFPYISATDVIHGKVPPQDLKDRIVLVGTSAPGLQDLRATPVASVYPGVEIHANLISGMLDGTIHQNPPYVLGAEVVLLLLPGVALALAFPLLNPLRATVLAGVMLIGVPAVNLIIWQKGGLVLPLASGMFMVSGLFALNMSYGFFVESRAKRQITGLFKGYVPPELVDEMALNPDSVSTEGESREMSVLFSDVRGFTTISESLDPKDLARLMNGFLTPLTQVIYRQRGTIDKYMGDCIMAFWGAPLPDQDHARHAVLTGLEMQARMRELEPEFKARGWPALHIGVGVNSGRMTVGNMGSEVRLAYTVMGDTVNLASRLEGITKQYGVGMVVGDNTRKAAPDLVYRELDFVRVKGRQEAVPIFEPLGPPDVATKARQEELGLWHKALRLYRAQEWDMAELQLMNLTRLYPGEALYRIFLDRLPALRSIPPGPGWDGAYTFESK